MTLLADRFAALSQQGTTLECLPEDEFQARAEAKRTQILKHHLNATNRSYAQLVGIETAWANLPILSKADLAAGGYAESPATDGPIVLTSTSGTTSTAVTLPHNPASIDATLGDNFLRALAVMEPVGERHWGIDHRAEGIISGSQLSMAHLQELGGTDALVTCTADDLDGQMAAAVAHQPWSISTAPPFLARIATHPLATQLRPTAVLFGGAALNATVREQIESGLRPDRIVGFYPSTDAGALGVDPDSSGVYRTFSETHWLEIIDADGQHVRPGERGDVVVTNYANLAAPFIRYRVGDTATFLGWERNRLLLRDIQRSAEVAIGGTLLPLADINGWTARLQATDDRVKAAQFVRRVRDGLDVPVVRIYTDHPSDRLATAAADLLTEQLQIRVEVTTGEIHKPEIEFLPPDSVSNAFKVAPYVDESNRGDT